MITFRIWFRWKWPLFDWKISSVNYPLKRKKRNKYRNCLDCGNQKLESDKSISECGDCVAWSNWIPIQKEATGTEQQILPLQETISG